MATIRLRDATVIADYGRPYIVAEINTSHFGNIETAKSMISLAHEIGCDCVKFQSWSADSLYSTSHYVENPIAERFVKKFSFNNDQLLELSRHCRELGVAFASTPYSRTEVDFLVAHCDVPFIKVASMELNNLPFLRHIARTNCPVVLSTGMGDIDEIHRAVDTIVNAGNSQLCILHCVAVYPTEVSNVRLQNILGLRNQFPDFPIGFSDHTVGVEIATAAVALGACLIEKHFTLDNSKIGMDNQMATEPDDMRLLVNSCRNVQAALGGLDRIVFAEEMAQRTKMRRSIIVTRDLASGAILTEKDLDAKRPGTGLAPAMIDELLGKRLVRDVRGDTLLSLSDITFT